MAEVEQLEQLSEEAPEHLFIVDNAVLAALDPQVIAINALLGPP